MIEVLVTVVIVGILAAIALPMYFDFVIRSKLIDGTSKTANFQSLLVKYYNDNNGTFVNPRGSAICGVPNPILAAADYFTISCIGATDTTYTVQADGIAARGTGGFRFTVDQTNAKATPLVPVGWTNNLTCWIMRKDGTC
jgi:type IV pilus assembly protein PilE